MLISITDIIVESWRLYKENFKHFFMYVLLMFIPTVFLLIAKFLLTYFVPSHSWGVIGSTFLIFAMLAIVFAVFAFWFKLAFVRVIAKRYTGQMADTIGKELSQSKKVFWPAVGVSILTALAVLGGMLLLIVPGIIFMLWFAFSYLVVAIDESSVMDGMHKSKALVDGRWWAVLGRLFVPSLVFGILAMIISWIVAIPLEFILSHTDKTSGLYAVWDIIGAIIISMGTALITPLTMSALVILYLELKKTPLAKPAMTPNMSDTPPGAPTA